MGIRAFLGNPPEAVRQWIINHPPTPPVVLTPWEKVVKNLENLPSCTFVGNKTQVDLGDNELPTPGSALVVKYMTIDGYTDGGTFVQTLGKSSVLANLDAIQAVDTEWIVLGYNANIPKYIKYKNGNSYKYVSSTGSGSTLAPVAVGATVYEKSWIASSLGNSYVATSDTVGAIGSGTFTYGQTNSDWGTTAGPNTYTVPMSLTIAGTEYAFCGYTMTLNSRRLLCTSEDGSTAYQYGCFDNVNYSNRWQSSYARAWCNSNQTAEYFYDDNEGISVNSNGLLTKFAKDQDFLKATQPVVNRIWKYDGDTTEDIEDRAFFLSNGEINISNGDYSFKDASYNTAIFSTVFSDAGCPYYDPDEFESAKLIKALLNLDGTTSSAGYWWLRSASSFNGDCVGIVFGTGTVSDDGASSTHGCSPALTIG